MFFLLRIRCHPESTRTDTPFPSTPPVRSPDTRRKLGILKQGIVLPAPSTPGAAAELNTIATRLQSSYGKGKGTLDGKPMSGNDLEEKMGTVRDRSEEHTSELQSLMRISYAVFCLKKKKNHKTSIQVH